MTLHTKTTQVLLHLQQLKVDQYDSMIRMDMGSLGKGKRILELLRRQTNLLSVGDRLKIFFNTKIRDGQTLLMLKIYNLILENIMRLY